jgi:hypothetical protein
MFFKSRCFKQEHNVSFWGLRLKTPKHSKNGNGANHNWKETLKLAQNYCVSNISRHDVSFRDIGTTPIPSPIGYTDRNLTEAAETSEKWCKCIVFV